MIGNGVIGNGLVLGLAAAWGCVVAAPMVRRARRETVRQRLETGRRGARSRGRVTLGRAMSALSRHVAPVAVLVDRWLAHRAAAGVATEVSHELPVTIDLLAVAVGAGATPYSATEVTARWAPSVVGQRLAAVMTACRLGADFAGALEAMVMATPALGGLAEALLASDRFGAPVGDALARLAAEERATLRRRAEARARTVPVRLLFPLVFLVLPAFGLLTVAPALLTGFARS